MSGIARIFGFIFATAAILFVLGASAGALIIWRFEQHLPDYTQLKNYEPPVMSRIYASDGTILGEYSKERRIFLPISAIPPLVRDAFISAEDKHFYTHHGIDPKGVLRALIVLVEGGRHIQGASTITQQVAKNFFLTDAVTITRKIKEAILAIRIESTFSKDKILELYLNQIYLGLHNYGIAAAALNYYNESVDQLTIAQMAYLAGLPKGPNNYQPFRDTQKAIERRNYVIERMVANGYISKAAGAAAEKEPLGVDPRVLKQRVVASDYFTEEVRREVVARFGEKKLYEGGLQIHTTFDPKMQEMARQAMVRGLVRFDESHGWRGPVTSVNISPDWGVSLAAVPALNDIQPWRMAVVLSTTPTSAKIGLRPSLLSSGQLSPRRTTGTITLAGMRWTRKGKVNAALHAGDVVYVAPDTQQPGTYDLRQVPKIEGAMVVMDPHTGRVLAMVGGFSFEKSSFNRATQAERQPGSTFKPFIYIAALDNGYTPSSIILDEPISIPLGNGRGYWTPHNFEKKSLGPRTLRFAIEHSINQMTVRLALDIGMPMISEYAKRFGIYDSLPNEYAFALGAGDTTLLKLVTGYSMIDNGGIKITPTLIDRIQDRYGNTIYRHDKRGCATCNAPTWHNQPEPKLVDNRPQVVDPMTAYQMTSILEGVVQRGTGIKIKAVGKHLAGKTGTSNDAKDLWFIGYSPDLAAGVFMGYDKPQSMGSKAQAADFTAPVFRDFMEAALKNKPDIPFRPPPGIKLISVNPHTGLRASGPGTILEAFKPGTAPPDHMVGAAAPQPAANAPNRSTDQAVGSGTGGLY
ncbi:MAG: penicillin-binding protein 1A [Hyphomicrobiales bacterium]|nr:penicillin-binding protein 1A [Hyphomicrobiales bacterium]